MLSTPVCYRLAGTPASWRSGLPSVSLVGLGWHRGKAVSFHKLNHLSALLVCLKVEKGKKHCHPEPWDRKRRDGRGCAPTSAELSTAGLELHRMLSAVFSGAREQPPEIQNQAWRSAPC